MFNALDEIPDALEAQPEGFHAGFAVALSSEEAAEHGDLADHRANRGRCFRDRFLGQNVSDLPVFVGEEQGRHQFWIRSPQAYQASQSPRDDHVHRQGEFDLADVAKLQGFDPATVLQHVEEGLNLPATAIPVNHFDDAFKSVGFAIRQQPPRDRLAHQCGEHRKEIAGWVTGSAYSLRVVCDGMGMTRPYSWRSENR
jgi:hypothetical protein